MQTNFLINKKYVLEKFSGKGGWTYIVVPEISPSKEAPFGWVTVSGFIDSFELVKVKLQPMGNGKLFLALKSSIRKNIKKEAGDTAHLKLNIDNLPTQIPTEIIECIENESKEIQDVFFNLSSSKQKSYLDWIYKAKTEPTKVKRILEMIKELSK